MEPSNAPTRADPKTYVLVHGAYHGAWCWDQVAALLRAEGNLVHTPTLPGLGERSHLVVGRPTLDIFIEDVADTIAAAKLKQVILVGHSFAGSVVSGIADRMPDRLRRLVYLDALVLQSGQAPFDDLPPEVTARYRLQAEETSLGLSVPPPAPAYFGITDPKQSAWVASRLTPHPYPAYLSKLHLRNPVGNGLPAMYIACSQPFFASTATSRAFAQTMFGWDYNELATGHDAMLLAPVELTRMLAAIG